MKNTIELIARLFLGHIFVLAGLNKLGAGYAGTAAYMDSMGVPGGLLPLVIALELVAGLMLIVGFKARWAAYALAGFSLLAAVIFHADFTDQMQMVLFMKNVSLAGGLLLLSVHGAGAFSVDAWMGERNTAQSSQGTHHAV